MGGGDRHQPGEILVGDFFALEIEAPKQIAIFPMVAVDQLDNKQLGGFVVQ